MTNTDRKLAEASFFLSKLDTQDQHFDYFLSAFLNAARSTTWIMRNEFHRIEGWEAWFNSIEIADDRKKLLKKINDLRILSTKQTGIKTDFLFLDTFQIDEEEYQKFLSLTDDPGEYILTISNFEEDSNSSMNNEHSFITEIDRTGSSALPSRIEMLTICKEYLELLNWLVLTCNKDFFQKK